MKRIDSGLCTTAHGLVGLLPIQRYTLIQGHVITPAVNWNAIREHANVSGRTLSSLARDLVHRGIWQVERFKTSMSAAALTTARPETTSFPCSSMNCPCSIATAAFLGHPDFHPGSIFVSHDDPTAVNGIVH